MRYPVLWERTAPERLDAPLWRWSDERLSRLRDLGIRPIIGLLHHGSGPRYTSLLDPDFAPKLARYARAVAERYPWVEAYTPVNEPLTTARFSALYGHWYPHHRCDSAFTRALVNQCRGIALAMRAIRRVQPEARLIQTEDLGKTFSTPALAYQAEFENERRWLTHDLLAGRVDRDHPMRSYLLWSGIDERDLDWFLADPIPPDVIGINHYVTSERFLDERTELYPDCTHGGNHRHRYADVEAVRVRAEGMLGPETMIREAWERYRKPMAITEAHLGCSREGQIRWLHEVWSAACTLRREGADVAAVTVWSLLGAYDWHTLMTHDEGLYEPGAFDIRGPEPRLTAIGAMLRDLAVRGDHDHPALDHPGWWRTEQRLIYPPVSASGEQARAHRPSRGSSPRPLLIAGAAGTLGRALARTCRERGIPHVTLTRDEMDIAESDAVERAISTYRPWGIINAAGYVRVDDAEHERERCGRENLDGPVSLAEACARHDLAFLTFSSDLVFDGEKGSPYVESDQIGPLSAYGWSKAVAERRVTELHSETLIVRTSAFFGPWDEHNMLTQGLRAITSGRPFEVADNLIVSPTYVPDLAAASIDLLIDRERGIWHLANQGAVSWADFLRMAADMIRADASLILPSPSASLPLTAARPRYSVLGSERASLMPSLEDAIARYVIDCGIMSEAEVVV